MAAKEQPVLEDGIKYWESQPASYDGVLGGFGTGSLPRVESLGSRQFLLHLMPSLLTVPSALRPLRPAPPPARRTRALDVGAGIGRVTSDTLLPLINDVVLLEPVDALVQAALAAAPAWRGIADASRSVSVFQGTLQGFDPARPAAGAHCLGRVGYVPDAEEAGFDVVWCQWCLMYMSDADVVAFFRRAKAALRGEDSVVVVKENVCQPAPDGGETAEFDEEDSSITRSDLAWKRVFRDAGLTLVHEKVQEGLPAGLFTVKMYAMFCL
ncbi:DUF858-domain-containing protein [Artomyces pyxidatus]|uniref:DUF858-domain-containing protein n=1 Tax=Artomyces pyxidatus TaxID=48021 RepID=A0ACB8TAA4_9AGAM|nr:DUF858-domain-containing protein [Artomyces pyxidatus]